MPASEAPDVVEFLVPGDPEQNTGGYRYVRKLAERLNEHTRKARVTGLPGRFPRPDEEAASALDQTLGAMPDGNRVVLDGLAMGGLPEVIEKHHQRLELLALVHHPLADESGLSEVEQQWFYESEKRALKFVSGVITTSEHTAARLADYDVPEAVIRVAEPGVAQNGADQRPSREVPKQGSVVSLLCVAHLSPRKAQHQLIEALQKLEALPWECLLVGSYSRDADYSESVRQLIAKAGLEQRIKLVGEVGDKELAGLYHQADIFVFPSLYEGYGMVVDEALATGLPIISSDGGALASTAARPGVVQFRAGDAGALADRIRRWLEHPDELADARTRAVSESGRIRTWQDTANDFIGALQYFSRYHPHSLFARDWLAAREKADHRARSRQLTDQLNRWLQLCHASHKAQGNPQPLSVVDLGAGRCSNAAFLVPVLQVPQAWLAIDQDAGLLQEGRARVEAFDVSFESAPVQLTPENMEVHLPGDISLITASALIDLVSETWLKALVEVATARQSAVLIVLSYAGHFELSPEHPDDSLLRNLINQHQHGDKGAGVALGPDASAVLEKALVERGYRVELAQSPWQLDASDPELIAMLMEGWIEAAMEQDPGFREPLTNWLAIRNAQLAQGNLKVQVNHMDLLALPSGEATWRI